MRTVQSIISPRGFRRGRGFTLIEIMVVVAIVGLMAAIGVPSLITMMQKKGMRKALSDVQDVCRVARANAVMYNRTESVIFHPLQGTFSSESGKAGNSGWVSSSALPDGVKIDMFFINQQDFGASEPARVFFYPDGTSDEMTMILSDGNTQSKITLEFATGFTTVSPVDR